MHTFPENAALDRMMYDELRLLALMLGCRLSDSVVLVAWNKDEVEATSTRRFSEVHRWYYFITVSHY